MCTTARGSVLLHQAIMYVCMYRSTYDLPSSYNSLMGSSPRGPLLLMPSKVEIAKLACNENNPLLLHSFVHFFIGFSR